MSSLFFLSLSKQSQAFSISARLSTRSFLKSRSTFLPAKNALIRERQPVFVTTTSRLYSFNRFNGDNENKKNKGVLARLKNKAKQYIPFLKTDKEKKAAIRKRRVKNELKSNIKEALRDAPFPIRAMGGMVGSVLGNAMSEFAEAAAEQGQISDKYYQQAVRVLQNDPSVRSILGTPVQVGPISSQSSSTTSINGKSMKQLSLGFVVTGTTGVTAQAQLAVQSNQSPTLQLRLNTGQIMSVSMTKNDPQQRFSSSKWKTDEDDDDSIIEAEIIEKKPSR